MPVLETGPESIIIQLRDMADKFSSVLDIRDMAIRKGGVGAVIIVFKNNELAIPSLNSNFLKENPYVLIKIKETLNLIENDLLIIISAYNKWRAFEAGLSIALDTF